MAKTPEPILFDAGTTDWIAVAYDDCWLTFLNRWIDQFTSYLGLSADMFWDTGVSVEPFSFVPGVKHNKRPKVRDGRGRARPGAFQTDAVGPRLAQPASWAAGVPPYYLALAKALGVKQPKARRGSPNSYDQRLLQQCRAVADAIRCVAVSLTKGRQNSVQYRTAINRLRSVQVPIWPVITRRLSQDSPLRARTRRKTGSSFSAMRKRVSDGPLAAAILGYLRAMGQKPVHGDLWPENEALGPSFDLYTDWRLACGVDRKGPASALYAALRCVGTDLLARVQQIPVERKGRNGTPSRCQNNSSGTQCPHFFIRFGRKGKYCDDHASGSRTYRATSKRQLHPKKKRKWEQTSGKFDDRLTLILKMHPTRTARDKPRMEKAAEAYLLGALPHSKDRPGRSGRVKGLQASYSHFRKNFDGFYNYVQPSTPPIRVR